MTWLRNRGNLGVLALVMGVWIISFSACNPEVVAHTKDVEITIDVEQVSAGFAQVRFSTNKEAFYLISIQPTQEGVDPQKIAKTFMLLSLDSAYADYLYWRNKQLQQHIPFVADFSSHSLQYGDIKHFFTLLQPGTEYWIYAFVVDPNTNKPAGKLFLETITTDSTSTIPLQFEYRVDGYWDYIYPVDSTGEVVSTIPWVCETIDSITIREGGWRVPGEYFFSRFKDVYYEDYERILYGIYAHNNDGVGDGTSSTYFQEGVTYYTGMAALDAPLVFPLPRHIYNIYRFTWHGDSTNLYLTPAQSLDGSW
ncbi:MAG: hypothetical protein IKV22_00780 [Paludibacteraceae bacterium]|nr:hypothetical protein [Paludibacteraceae bacterium]